MKSSIINDRHELPDTAKAPILAKIARALGWLCIIGLIFGALMFAKTYEGQRDIHGFLFAAAYALGSALVFFGIGEVIHLIAKIEHNTAQRKDQAILDSLHRIESLLELKRSEK